MCIWTCSQQGNLSLHAAFTSGMSEVCKATVYAISIGKVRRRCLNTRETARGCAVPTTRAPCSSLKQVRASHELPAQSFPNPAYPCVPKPLPALLSSPSTLPLGNTASHAAAVQINHADAIRRKPCASEDRANDTHFAAVLCASPECAGPHPCSCHLLPQPSDSPRHSIHGSQRSMHHFSKKYTP